MGKWTRVTVFIFKINCVSHLEQVHTISLNISESRDRLRNKQHNATSSTDSHDRQTELVNIIPNSRPHQIPLQRLCFPPSLLSVVQRYFFKIKVSLLCLTHNMAGQLGGQGRPRS